METPSFLVSNPGVTFNQWKTYVCLVDHTSTATTPENDATNWIEAGNSREYPYFCLNGSLTSGSGGAAGEIYLDALYYRYATTGYEGMLYYHTREGVADNEAGKIVLMGDVFSGWHSVSELAFNRLIIESDPTQEVRASIAFVAGAQSSGTIGIGQSCQGGKVPCRSEFKNLNLYFLGDRANVPYFLQRGDSNSYNGGAFYLENCKVSDRGSEVGLANPPISNYVFSLTYNNYLSAKGTVFDFGYTYFSHNIFYTGASNHFQAHASGSTTPLDTSLVNCTLAFVSATDKNLQSSATIFYNIDGGTIKNCIVYIENTKQLGSIGWLTGTGAISESNCAFIKNFTGGAGAGLSAASGLTVANPLFVDALKGNLALRPSSPCIGGLKEELTGVFWLNPGNSYNGDGSAKGPASADGQPGAFNSFTAVKDAAVAGNVTYGSTVVIVNGTYSWPSEFTKNPSNGVTYEGFIYQAESNGDVIFDAVMSSNWFGFNDGGIEKNTSFIGIVFKNLNAIGSAIFRNSFGFTGGDRTSTVIFDSCQFLNIITGGYYGTFGLSQSVPQGPYVHMFGCSVHWASDDNAYSNCLGYGPYGIQGLNGWKIENNTFFQGGVGLATFAGRNAACSNGYYAPGFTLGGADMSQMTFKNNIVSSNATGVAPMMNELSAYSLAGKSPVFQGNAFHNVLPLDGGNVNRVDPATNLTGVAPDFVDTSNNNYSLRPYSPLVGGVKTYPSGANIWYIDFGAGNDSNDGKSPATAMATLSAVHTASANDDTIYIVDRQVTLSSDLIFDSGRVYIGLNHCSFDGADSYHVEINNAADAKTELIKFKFLNLNNNYFLVGIIGSNTSTIIKIKSCEIAGKTTARCTVIGNNSVAGSPGAIGQCIKDTSIFCTFLYASTSGANSQGFHNLNNCEMSGCTLVVGPNSDASNTYIFIAGRGGYGAWSHGPPQGRQIVKDCIVYGNNKMTYGTIQGAGNGFALGFVSNTGVTWASANFIVYNTSVYGILGANADGEWPTYSPSDLTPTNYKGPVKSELGISDSLAVQLFYQDPLLINPDHGEVNLRPTSDLIGKGI